VTKGREEDERGLPALPESIPALERSTTGLALAGPTDAGVFLLEGERAFVLGAQRGPVQAISIDGVPTVTGFDAGLGTAANIIVLPGMAHREFVSPQGLCMETIVVPPTLPFVVVQWGVGGGTLPRRILVDVALRGGDARPEKGPHGLMLTFQDDRVVALGSSPAPLEIETLDPENDAVRVSVRPPEKGPFHLVIAAGPMATVRSAFAASAHLTAHAGRAAGGPCHGGLTLQTGVTELDESVDWARARLRGIIDRAAVIGPSDSRAAPHTADAPFALSAGLAAIGTGDREGARRATSMQRLAGTPTAALLAARFASQFGDASLALKHARKMLERATPDLEGHGVNSPANPGPGDRSAFHAPSLRALALRALADGLRHTAPQSMIAELRQAAAATDHGPAIETDAIGSGQDSGSTGGRRLPVVSGPPSVSGPTTDVSWSQWLPGLLAGEPSIPTPSGSNQAGDLIRRTGALFRTDPDAAWVDWRNALSAGLTSGPAGPGSWDALTSAPDHGSDSATAELLLALVHGLLGLEADAPVGRIRIAPRLPRHLTALGVRGITLGDSVLRMEYRRSGATHRFTLEPEIASVPPLVVFEPAVHGRIRELRVDGRVADLDLRSAGPMTVAPVQIPIDGQRSVDIVTE